MAQVINVTWVCCAKFNLTASYLRCRSSKLALQGEHGIKIERTENFSTETTILRTFSNAIHPTLPTETPIEEETLHYYKPDQYYPVKTGDIQDQIPDRLKTKLRSLLDKLAMLRSPAHLDQLNKQLNTIQAAIPLTNS